MDKQAGRRAGEWRGEGTASKKKEERESGEADRRVDERRKESKRKKRERGSRQAGGRVREKEREGERL